MPNQIGQGGDQGREGCEETYPSREQSLHSHGIGWLEPANEKSSTWDLSWGWSPSFGGCSPSYSPRTTPGRQFTIQYSPRSFIHSLLVQIPEGPLWSQPRLFFRPLNLTADIAPSMHAVKASLDPITLDDLQRVRQWYARNIPHPRANAIPQRNMDQRGPPRHDRMAHCLPHLESRHLVDQNKKDYQLNFAEDRPCPMAYRPPVGPRDLETQLAVPPWRMCDVGRTAWKHMTRSWVWLLRDLGSKSNSRPYMPPHPD
jgi:hypothetical protein